MVDSETLMQKIKEDLESKMVKLVPNDSTMHRIKHDLSKAYREEELYQKQRSKIQWLKMGVKHRVEARDNG